MADPSNLRFHPPISDGEMLRLFAQHDMEQKLSFFRSEQTLVDQGPMHHAFCCKVTLIEYFDSISGVPMVTIDLQTPADRTKSPVRTIRLLRIDDNIYIHELASKSHAIPGSHTVLDAPQGAKVYRDLLDAPKDIKT